jgi:hypothetical protein
VGTPLKRLALSTMIKGEKASRTGRRNEFAIRRKLAIDVMKRSIDAAIDKVTQTYGKAIVSQLDCSCAFNRAPRQNCLTEFEEEAPQLLLPIGQWLTTPMTHILKRDDGKTETIIPTDGLPPGLSFGPFGFLLVHARHRWTTL